MQSTARKGFTMRKFIGATAALALGVGLVAGPGAAAKPGQHGPAGPKNVAGTVTVNVTPTTITPTTTSVTASGNVAASSSCRKDRTVHFAYVNGTTVTPLAQTAETGPNGNYSAVLPKPTDVAPATVTLQATVDAVTRKVGSKKKGKKTKKGRVFNCLEASGQSSPLSVTSP
jgi:hypothetical protein